MDWRELTQDPTSLSEARLQLHHAAQLVSGVGRTFLEKQPDDSHTTLTWSRRDSVLVGRPLEGCLVSLALGPGELRVSTEAGKTTGFALATATLAEAERWLLRELDSRTQRPLGDSLAPLHYEIPRHEVGEGGVFSQLDPSFAELESWFANADALLMQIREEHPHTTDILCWPHHFDIALLIELDRDKEVEQPRTIGVGMSPGDESCDEPYLYIGPYPRPADLALPALSNGEWRTEGAFNAVLRGSELTATGSTAAQAELAIAFLHQAIEASMEILEHD